MFYYEKDPEKIGSYLKKLIEQHYPSHRQFCKAYLIASNISPTDDELKKMSNRLSQMLKGNKAIQTYDLPIFTNLLQVSCEEILSCGKSFVPISGHITNYEVAFSSDPAVWKAYSERPDKLILNADEYNKTVLDYAIEFKNYPFIKYLMDSGNIWFFDGSKEDCKNRILGFSAGTNIKKRGIGSIDTDLSLELQYRCEEQGLRQNIIAMALENEDFAVLDSLRARENPALYQLCLYGGNTRVDCSDYYNEDVIEAIAKSNGDVLHYFSDEFKIKDSQGREHRFVYPFLNELIEKLIVHKSAYVELVIQASIEHNRKIYSALSAMVNDAAAHVQSNYPDWMEYSSEAVKKEALRYFDFFPENNFISYVFPLARQKYSKLCTNIVYTDAVSDDPQINSLLKELNRLFDAVKNIESVISINQEA